MTNPENPSQTYLVYKSHQNGDFVDTEIYPWPSNDSRSIMCRDDLLEQWTGPTEVLYWGTDRSAASEALIKVDHLPRLFEEL